MPQLIFIEKNGRRHACAFTAGETILAVVQRHSTALEGTCEGSMACATCHIQVDKDWFARLPLAKMEENAMLDLAPGVKRTSRLGCQVVLTDELDGLTVSVG